MTAPYLDTELEAALHRAFVEQRCDYIILDNRRAQFLCESAAFGMRSGWLSEHEWKGADGGEQDYALHYRLTLAGKKHFGVSR